MCPEMLLGKGYDFKADVWSVGVVAYAFLFGTFPYMPKIRDAKLMKNAIVEGASPTFTPVGRHTTNGSKFRSSAAIEFVRSLLSRQPEQRPSAIEALNVEYMTSIADDCHALSDDLPSLEPMISSAQTAGVFDFQDVHKQVHVDVLLNELQMQKHQVPLLRKRPMNIKISKDTSSDNMSVPSTACPSETPPSRRSSKMSVESKVCPSEIPSRRSSKMSVESRVCPSEIPSRRSSKFSVESRVCPSEVPSRRSSKISVESRHYADMESPASTPKQRTVSYRNTRLSSKPSGESMLTQKNLDMSNTLSSMFHETQSPHARCLKAEA
jgi:serine/threonine protein kinase